MFTGLIEEIGEIVDVQETQDRFDLSVRAQNILDGAQLGDSIAVNGVCLTVTKIDGGIFKVGLAPETLRRTSLGACQPGAVVNLERALTPTSRMGGHYVQGHVDTTGIVKNISEDRDALWVEIQTPPHLMRYIAGKGYIAIDGASLTVVDTGADWFNVTLVRYTQDKITLARKKPGERVNLEVDILAKYVEKLVSAHAGAKFTAPDGRFATAKEGA